MPHSKCVFCRGRSFAFKESMHSVKVKRPSATDQRRYKATISRSVEAKSSFSTKMSKSLRRNHNNKKLLLPGAGYAGPWFCRGKNAKICKSDCSVEAKRYRPGYAPGGPMKAQSCQPDGVLQKSLVLSKAYQKPAPTRIHRFGTAKNQPAPRSSWCFQTSELQKNH